MLEGDEGAIYYAFPLEWRNSSSVGLGKRELDQKDGGAFTRHERDFVIEQPASSKSDDRYPDKAELAQTILAMLDAGHRYADIARELCLDPARIRQIAIAHGRPSATRARPRRILCG